MEVLDEWLEDRFGLTTAESRLAIALFRGLSLRQFATLRGTSVHTARVQLASIFLKAGVRRQAELILLIMTADTSPPLWAHPRGSTSTDLRAVAG